MPAIRNKLLLLPAILPATLLFAGCNTTGCMDNRSSLLLAGFYSASDKAISLQHIEVGGVGAPNDSLIIEAGESTSEVYLPLRHTDSSTSFFIRYLNSDVDLTENFDTITLTYSSIPYFASEECGAIYQYSIKSLEYTTHFIDRVTLLDSLINNADMQKMHIYFLTD